MATVLNIRPSTRSLSAHVLPDEAHVVQFYTEDSFLLESLAASLGNSLQTGESVVAVMTKTHQKGLLKRFSARGIDADKSRRCGRLVLLDAADTLKKFMDPAGPNRQKFLREIGSVLRKAEGTAEAKGKRVAVFGEMVAVLWSKKKYDAAIRLEQLWNELAQTHFFHLRCAYPAKWFKGQGGPYSMICAEHSVVIPA